MKFDIRLLKSIDLEQVNSENGRYYKSADSDQHFYSVTTFLSKTADQKWLESWRKRVGEAEATRISERAKERGNTIHGYFEDYIFGNDFTVTKYAQHFKSVKNRLDRGLSSVYGIEHRLMSHELGLAGTADLIGKFNGLNSIIDFKGSNKPKKLENITDYVLQCLIYSKMVKELYGIHIQQLVILIAVESTYTAQQFVIPEEEFDKYNTELENRMLRWNSLLE